MLNPESVLLPAIVAALQSNADLVSAMSDDASRIYEYRYVYGKEPRLELAINAMKAPSVMVAWSATLPGNFNGSEIWKHQFDVYIRLGNQANAVSAIGYAEVWARIVNGAVNGGSQNIRSVQLVTGADIMDTPGIIHIIDEERQDLFCGRFVIPEIGDN